MFVEILYRRKFRAVRQFLYVVITLCVCVGGGAKAALTMFNNIQRFAVAQFSPISNAKTTKLSTHLSSIRSVEPQCTAEVDYEQTSFPSLYDFFWVIPASEFHMLTFRNTLFHLYMPMKMEQSVSKRRHIKFSRRGITQNKAHSIQKMAKV